MVLGFSPILASTFLETLYLSSHPKVPPGWFLPKTQSLGQRGIRQSRKGTDLEPRFRAIPSSPDPLCTLLPASPAALRCWPSLGD